jgi:bifunctional non-homologous end joining protein LigD
VLKGKRVVVTGKVAGESRSTAQAKLQDAGAIVQSAVNSDTDLLITGERVGAKKIAAAQQLGVMVVTWDEAFTPSPNGRTVSTVTAAREYVKRHGIDELPLAVRTVAPMLAKAGELPIGPEWLYEVKWDGIRGIATVRDGRVAIQSRSAKSALARDFPQIAVELGRLPDCTLDGELVVLDSDGNSSLASLGGRRREASYVVFDALELRGRDLRGLTLSKRRAKLADFLIGQRLQRVAISPAFDDGEDLLTWAAEQEVEGIVAKRRSSTYREGSRTDAWTKVKLRGRQEFAVVGWKPGDGARSGQAGSLLLAVHDGQRFVYAGRVGTGMTEIWRDVTTLTRTSKRPHPRFAADAPRGPGRVATYQRSMRDATPAMTPAMSLSASIANTASVSR